MVVLEGTHLQKEREAKEKLGMKINPFFPHFRRRPPWNTTFVFQQAITRTEGNVKLIFVGGDLKWKFSSYAFAFLRKMFLLIISAKARLNFFFFLIFFFLFPSTPKKIVCFCLSF